MKKLLLICAALVVALGGLGVGYAMWSDTVTISGSVQTGSVDLEILWGSFDRVYKNLETDALVYEHIYDGTNNPPYLPYYKVGETKAIVVDENTLRIEYINIFPIPGSGFFGDGCWLTDFRLKNNGTIPVKIKKENIVITGIPAEWVKFCESLAVDGLQIHPGQDVSCCIKVCIPQPPDNTGMGITDGSISFDLKGIQWNEYPAE